MEISHLPVIEVNWPCYGRMVVKLPYLLNYEGFDQAKIFRKEDYDWAQRRWFSAFFFISFIHKNIRQKCCKWYNILL